MDKNKKSIKIQKIILAYLQKHGKVPKKNLLDFRYLDEGIIDSLNLIKFIFYLEKKFEIKIKAKDSESDQFRYIGGLIHLILKKIK